MLKIETPLLKKLLTFVAPAISSHEIVPVLTHFCFTKNGWIEAYDGSLAARIRTDFKLNCAVPGQLLQHVTTITERHTSLELLDDTLKVVAGRAKVELKTMPASDFVFQRPEDADALVCFTLNTAFLLGLKECLVTVGNSHANVEQLGVTMQWDGDCLFLLSTDNATISCYEVGDVSPTYSRPADKQQLTMPTEFCRQVLALAAAYPDANIDILTFTGSIMASIEGEAEVFSQLQMDYRKIDLLGITDKHLDEVDDYYVSIPFAMKSAMARASICRSKDGAVDTLFELHRGTLTMTTENGASSVTDEFTEMWDDLDDITFKADPKLVTRILEHVDDVALTKTALVFKSAKTNLQHLISFARG